MTFIENKRRTQFQPTGDRPVKASFWLAFAVDLADY